MQCRTIRRRSEDDCWNIVVFNAARGVLWNIKGQDSDAAVSLPCWTDIDIRAWEPWAQRKVDRTLKVFWAECGKTKGCRACDLGPGCRSHSSECKDLQKKCQNMLNVTKGDEIFRGAVDNGAEGTLVQRCQQTRRSEGMLDNRFVNETLELRLRSPSSTTNPWCRSIARRELWCRSRFWANRADQGHQSSEEICHNRVGGFGRGPEFAYQSDWCTWSCVTDRHRSLCPMQSFQTSHHRLCRGWRQEL